MQGSQNGISVTSGPSQGGTAAGGAGIGPSSTAAAAAAAAGTSKGGGGGGGGGGQPSRAAAVATIRNGVQPVIPLNKRLKDVQVGSGFEGRIL